MLYLDKLLVNWIRCGLETENNFKSDLQRIRCKADFASASTQWDSHEIFQFLQRWLWERSPNYCHIPKDLCFKRFVSLILFQFNLFVCDFQLITQENWFGTNFQLASIFFCSYSSPPPPLSLALCLPYLYLDSSHPYETFFSWNSVEL